MLTHAPKGAVGPKGLKCRSYGPLKFPHMFVQGSHAFAIFTTPWLREGRGFSHINVNLYPIRLKLEYRLPACSLWLQPNYVEISGHFLLSVLE